MQTDPMTDPGAGDGTGDGAKGANDPKVSDLEQRNAELRQKNRELEAKVLGAEHGLTPTQVELLGNVDLEKQADVASRLAGELKPAAADPAPSAPQPPADTQGQQQPTPPAAPPPETPQAQADQQDAMAGGGQTPSPGTPTASTDPYVAKIDEIAKSAKSPADAWAEIRQYQLDEQRRAIEESGQ